MKLLNRPKIMEDELFFSYIHRTAEANAMPILRFLNEYVKNKKTDIYSSARRLSYGSNNYITEIATNLGMDPEDLFLRTTLYPAMAPTLGKGMQSHWINHVFRGAEQFPKIITPPISDISSVKICKKCMEEEIKSEGFFWYHRSHNLPGVCMCHKHQVPLLEYRGKYGEELVFEEANFEPISVEYPEINLEYSVFAHDFLDLAMDTDRTTIRRVYFDDLDIEMVLIRHSFYWEKLGGNSSVSFSDWQNYLTSLSTNSFQFMLTSFFIMFESIDALPKQIVDIEMHKKFLSAAQNDYIIYAPYRATLVTMKKKGEEESFVTTPYGFLAGWRSPSEDACKSEHDKFDEIVQLSRNGRYVLKSDFQSTVKKVTLLDTKCGNDYVVRAGVFLDAEVDCPCTFRLTPEKLKKEIDNNEFTLVDVDLASKKKSLTIQHTGGCGHSFEIGYRAWKKDHTCRFCGKTHRGLPLKNTDPSYEKTRHEEFVQCVKNLTGDEYVVCSEYQGAYIEVEIKHLKCGKSKMYKPIDFNSGKRCNCQKWVSGPDFIAFVEKYSKHRYSVVRFKGSRYRITDNTNECEDKLLRKERIIQELIRPTPSPILPLEEKDTTCSPYAL